MISLLNFGEAPLPDGSRQIPCQSRFFPFRTQIRANIGSIRAPKTMDFSLRCNSLKCRIQLTDRAVVTTCRFVRDSATICNCLYHHLTFLTATSSVYHALSILDWQIQVLVRAPVRLAQLPLPIQTTQSRPYSTHRRTTKQVCLVA